MENNSNHVVGVGIGKVGEGGRGRGGGDVSQKGSKAEVKGGFFTLQIDTLTSRSQDFV